MLRREQARERAALLDLLLSLEPLVAGVHALEAAERAEDEREHTQHGDQHVQQRVVVRVRADVAEPRGGWGGLIEARHTAIGRVL